jgi:hypothetical protein
VVILGAGASRACCPNGDKNGLKLPLMNDFIRITGIEYIIAQSGHDPSGNFEKIYSDLHRSGNQQAIDQLGSTIEKYFSGIVLQEQPTLYDYLVLSLRPRDLIVTFNWDPLLPQAYKRWRHLGKVLPELAFLHGNIDVGVNVKKKQSAFLSDQPKFSPTPLLYPVENKDYNSDPFVADQWAKATAYLSDAYYITIIGYSAPVTDVEARSLLLEAWKNNTTRTLDEFDIIDIRPSEEVETSWSDFLEGIHDGASPDALQSYLMLHPRRTCEAFAFATLQQDPWHEDRFSADQTLEDLEAWIRPLIDEENTGTLSGKPHHSPNQA